MYVVGIGVVQMTDVDVSLVMPGLRSYKVGERKCEMQEEMLRELSMVVLRPVVPFMLCAPKLSKTMVRGYGCCSCGPLWSQTKRARFREAT